MNLANLRYALIALATASACTSEVPVDPGQPPANPSVPTWSALLPAAIANDNEPTLQGKADARATIHVYASGCDGALLGTTVTDATGAFVLRVKVADDSVTSFHALASDADGRSSDCSEPLVYTEDSTAPDAPVWPTTPLAAANENAPVLEGIAEAGATVRIFKDACTGASVAELVADADGSFRAQVQVEDDSQTDFYASAIDAAGNVSPCSAARRYVEDSTPPDAPIWTGVLPAPIADENHPTLQGTSEPGSTIRVFAQADCAGVADLTVIADEAGAFAGTYEVADDSVTTFTAAALDAAGNASACSASLVYTELSQPPAAPVWTGVLPGALANENEPTVEGQAAPGVTIEIFAALGCAGDPVATAQADAQGLFTATVQVEDDSTTQFSAIAVNAAGIRSSCSAELAYVEDSLAPQKPVLTGTTPASPSTSAEPVLAGTAEPGTTVRVYLAGLCTGTAIETAADASGAFQLQLQVGQNKTVSIVASAVDAAGNVSSCSAPLTYVSDATAPAAPVLTGFSPASPSSVPSPKLLGTAEARSAIEIFAGAGCTGSAVATSTTSAGGAIDVAVTAVANGSATFSARASDAAGNVSDCSNAISYEHDDVAPDAPTLVSISPGPIANDNSPEVSGTAGANLRIELFVGACSGLPKASGSADAIGAFTIAVSVNDDTTNAIHARAVDPAGNASSCSGPLQYIEDSTPPSRAVAVVLDGLGADREFQKLTTELAASWSGFTDANGVVSYERNVSRTIACLGEVVPAFDIGPVAEHVWTGTLTEGLHINCIRAVDEAGNRSGWRASNGITVDATPPALASMTPVDGATNVDLRTSVVLTFSEVIAETPVPSLGLLIDGQPHPVTTTWNANRTIATLNPELPYPHLASVQVVVRAGLTDLAGNATASDTTRSFTVRDWRWQTPARLQAQTAWGGYTTIDTDDQGRVVAIWGEGNNPWRLWTKTFVPGQGWGTATRLAPAAPAATVDPAISLANGVGVAAWSQEDGPRYNLYASRWSAATGWATPELIETHAASARSPKVHADAAGNLFVAWTQIDGLTTHVWVNHYTPASGWGTAVQLETLSYGTRVHGVHGNGSGAMAVWVNGGKVKVSRFTPGSGWAASEQINVGEPAFAYDAWTAMAPDGSALVVYDSRNGTTDDLLARRYTPGVGWSSAQLMPSSPGLDCENPSVGIDAAGNALVLWTQKDAGVANLYWRRHDANGWTSPVRLAEEVSSASMALGHDGRAHAAYAHYIGTGYRISTVRFDPASGWSSPSTLESLAHPSSVSGLNVGADGTAALIWMRGHQNWWEEQVFGSIFD